MDAVLLVVPPLQQLRHAFGVSVRPLKNETPYDSWTEPDPESYLWNEPSRGKVHSPPSYILRKRGVVCMCVVCLCSAGVPRATLWEDELRRRGAEECCGYLGVCYCAGNVTRPRTQARTSLDCGAVKPQHNDPQLLVCRELLSAAPNKVPAPYAWDSRTLLHLPGVFYMHQSITFTYPG